MRLEPPPTAAGVFISTALHRPNPQRAAHTVGPFWRGGKQGEAETLASCHRESIRIADELELASIAFPAISTGAYGYPVEPASHVAITSAAEALAKAKQVREVRFVLYDSGTFTPFSNAARAFAASSSLKVDLIP